MKETGKRVVSFLLVVLMAISSVFAGMPSLTEAAASKTGFVQTNGTKFTLDGSDFYYAGTNNYYINFKSSEDVDVVMQDAGDMGLTVIRTWGHLDAGTITDETEADGTPIFTGNADGDGHKGGIYYQYFDADLGRPVVNEGETGLQKMDYVLAKAAEHDIKVILTLTNYWTAFGGMEQYVAWAGKSGVETFYTDATIKQWFKDYIYAMLNHTNVYTGVKYKDDPTIFAWELANEPRYNAQNKSGDANGIYTWASEMSSYIKELDSNHMVAVGDEGGMYYDSNSDWAAKGANQVPAGETVPTGLGHWNGSMGNFHSLMEIETIDFGTPHLYPGVWGMQSDAELASWLKLHADVAHAAGKPIILEEFGWSNKEVNESVSEYNAGRDSFFRYIYGKVEEYGYVGSNFWMLGSHTTEDAVGYYPDYDGFTIYNFEGPVSADGANRYGTNSIIIEHAAYMNAKGDRNKLSADSITYDKANPSVASVTVTPQNGAAVDSVEVDGITLDKDSDYTVNGNVITFAGNYLKGLEDGTYYATIHMTLGASLQLTVVVKDSNIHSAVIANGTYIFDKNVYASKDVVFPVSVNDGGALKGVYVVGSGNVKTPLEVTAYNAENGNVTIYADYLKGCNTGSVNLLLDYTNGTDPIGIITVMDTTGKDVVDDFEGYGSNAAVAESWIANESGDTPSLAIVTGKSSSKALSYSYDISSNGYAGIAKNISGLAVTAFDGFSFWVQADDTANKNLTIQLREPVDENNSIYWEVSKNWNELNAASGNTVKISFSEFKPKSSDYDGIVQPENGQVCGQNGLSEFSIYVGGTDKTGSFYMDDIRLYTDGSSTPEEPNPEEPNPEEPEESGKADISHMPSKVTMVDKNATNEAKAVYAFLHGMTASAQVVFGHQNDNSRTVTASESDTKDLTGSLSGLVAYDSLAVTGSELGVSTSEGLNRTVASAKAAAAQGAIISLSLHMPNFATMYKDGSSDFSKYDFESSKDLSGDCVGNILPGKKCNELYNAYLDVIVDFAKQLQEDNIPVILRPLHENNGGWFWWGSGTTPEVYKALYRYTVNYFKDAGVHNFIYEYSPNGPIVSREDFLSRYPGDAYVDILAMDYYSDYYSKDAAYDESFLAALESGCEIISSLAEEKGKIAAIAETGVRVTKDNGDNNGLLISGNPILGHDWYNEVNNVAKKTGMSYFLLWANFSNQNFYVPYKFDANNSQELANEFISFYNQPSSIFANDISLSSVYAKADSITVESYDNVSGYMINPVDYTEITEKTTFIAQVVNATRKVVFKIDTGDGTPVTVEAAGNGSTYTADITDLVLAEIGETDTAIVTLESGNTVIATASYVSFGKTKPVMPSDYLDNYEYYFGDEDYLASRYNGSNSAAGCSSSVNLTTKNRKDGSYAGEFKYVIAYSGADVYTGTGMQLTNTDFTGKDAFSFWIVPDGYGQKFVIQVVSGGQEFEADLTEFMKKTAGQYVTIPFSSFVPKIQGAEFDESDVTGLYFYCNSIPANVSAEMKDASGNYTIQSSVYVDCMKAIDVPEATVIPAGTYLTTDAPADGVEDVITPDDGEGGSGEGGSGNDGSGESGSGEGGSGEGGSGDDGSGDDGSGEGGSGNDGSGNDGSGEGGSGNDGSGNDGSGEGGSGDDGSGEGGSGEDGSGDDGSGEGGNGDDGSGEGGSGEGGSGNDGSGEGGSGDDGSGESGSGDDGSGDDGSGNAGNGNESIENPDFVKAFGNVAFDKNSTYDEVLDADGKKAEYQMANIGTAGVPNKGFTISAKVAIPGSAETRPAFSGEMKFKIAARLGANWDYVSPTDIPAVRATDLIWDAENQCYYAGVTTTFDDNIEKWVDGEKQNISGFEAAFTEAVNAVTIECAGYLCDYSGNIYISEVVLRDDEEVIVPTVTNATAPVFTVHPSGNTYECGASALLAVTAQSTDGGALSYQWYKNTVNSTTGGIAINGAVASGYAPVTTTPGTTYYYCVITNTNNHVNGTKTASVVSAVAAVTVKAKPSVTVEKAANQITGVSDNYKKTIGNKAFLLGAAGQGTITYTSSDTKVATVDASTGKVTIKGTGKAVITITASGNVSYLPAARQVTIQVVPKKQKITSIKSAKTKSITLKWKKDKKSKGYQIQYSTSRKFKNAKTITIKKYNTYKKTITKLKAGKKYYVRVRAYGKNKTYGNWSNTVNIKTKKE